MVSVDSWCSSLTKILGDTGWTVSMESPKVTISHSTSPFESGTLLRFTFPLFVQDLQDESQCLLVRPEVRAKFGVEDPFSEFLDAELSEVTGPGDVLVRSSRKHGMKRLIRGIFGDFSSGLPSDGLFRSVHMRNYPAHGEFCVIMVPENIATLSCLTHGLRCSAGCYQMSYVIHMPGADSMFLSTCISLISPFLQRVIRRWESLHNRPQVAHMREVDQNFYVVLTLSSCKRGPPLLPASEIDATVELTHIADRDFAFWKHQESGMPLPFAEYLRLFLRHLLPAQTWCIYDSMDVRKLVPYQCVMKNAQWESIKPDIMRAFLTHRTAYRHAYGGSTAPALKDTLEVRFQHVVAQSDCGVSMKEESAPFVVRNTFIEFCEEDCSACELHRNPRRNKTVMVLPEIV